MSTGNFVIQIGPRQGDKYRLQVEESPVGTTTTTFRPPVEGCSPTYRDLCPRPEPAPQDGLWDRPESEIRRFGVRLYQSLFQGEVRDLFLRSREKCTHLRIHIRMDPRDGDLGEIRSLPWELLCDPKTRSFLFLSDVCSIARLVEVPYGSLSSSGSLPLRILAVTSNPDSCRDLNVARELEDLKSLEQRTPDLSVDLLEDATLQDLRDTLRKGHHQILHYIGHGSFDPESGTGWLGFKRFDGTEDQVRGETLAAKLQGCPDVRLVFLNACNSGTDVAGTSFKPFAGLANALILSGIPSVLAMQQPIRDRAAIQFSRKFYQNLVEGQSLDTALSEGRQAIHSESPERPDWAIPCLFTRDTKGQVIERLRPAGRAENLSERVERPVGSGGQLKRLLTPAFLLVLLFGFVAVRGIDPLEAFFPSAQVALLQFQVYADQEPLAEQRIELTFLGDEEDLKLSATTGSDGGLTVPVLEQKLPVDIRVESNDRTTELFSIGASHPNGTPELINLSRSSGDGSS